MSDPARVEQLVHRAIDEVNLHRSGDEQIEKNGSVKLIGENGVLDSLGVISLLVMIEEEAQTEFSASISLVEDEQVIGGADGDGSVQTVEQLVAHVRNLIGEAGDG